MEPAPERAGEPLTKAYRRAQRHLRRGEYALAAGFFRECLLQDSQNLHYLYGLGVAEQNLGLSQEAGERFAAVIALDPAFEDTAARLAAVSPGLRRPQPASLSEPAAAPGFLAVNPAYGPGLGEAFAAQRRVLLALILREFRLNYGRYQLRYLWLLIEPALHVLVLWLAFQLIRERADNYYGVPLATFLVIGVVPWIMFRRILRDCMGSIESDRSLYDYRQVRPLDVVVAVCLFQYACYLGVFAIFLFASWWLGWSPMPAQPLELALALLLFGLLAMGLGLLIAVACSLYAAARRLAKPVLRLLHFISGVFFTIEMLPASTQPYLLWNPLLHALDLIKGALLPAYDSPGSFTYLASFSVLSLFAALAYYTGKKRALLET